MNELFFLLVKRLSYELNGRLILKCIGIGLIFKNIEKLSYFNFPSELSLLFFVLCYLNFKGTYNKGK